MVKGPRWRELADAIEADIRSGERQPGSRLPSLTEWGDGYSSSTVLRVYRWLTARGLVTTVQGTGTFVADAIPAQELTLEERVAELERWRAEVEDGR